MFMTGFVRKYHQMLGNSFFLGFLCHCSVLAAGLEGSDFSLQSLRRVMGNKDSKPSTSSLEKHEISSGSSSGSDGSDRRRDENYKHNSCVMSIRNVSAYPILCVGDSLTAGIFLTLFISLL